MGTVYVKITQDVRETLHLVKTVVEAEIIRLELALEVAQKRLEPFEKKYGVSSEHFISNTSAEDLAGGDEKYVTWSGEIAHHAILARN